MKYFGRFDRDRTKQRDCLQEKAWDQAIVVPWESKLARTVWQEHDRKQKEANKLNKFMLPNADQDIRYNYFHGI